MIRPLFALFTRSVMEDCRGRTSYAIRGLLLGVTLLFLFVMHLGMRGGAPGLQFFAMVLNLNCFFITIVGVSHFASAITEEKEEMTLGLLRMTDLDPISILLGKSASRMLNAVFLLLVQFPFTLLAVSLGGVSIVQIVAAYCTLAAYILLLGCVALFCSVVCRRTTGATSLTLAFLIAFFFGPNFSRSAVAGFVYMGWMNGSHPLFDTLAKKVGEASPFSGLGHILQTGFAGPAVGFQVLSNVVAGVFFFLLAWLAFNRFTRRETDASPARDLIFRRTSPLRWFSAGRTWDSALFWKDFYFMAGGKMGMLIKFILLGAVALFAAWQVIPDGPVTRWSNLGGIILSLSSVVLVVELAVAAARIFRQEIMWQTLSSISILPISVRSFVYQKGAGHLVAALPAVFYLLLGAFLLIGNETSGITGDDVLGIVVVIAECLFFIHLTAYLSLLMKRGALPAAFVLTFVANMAWSVLLTLMPRGGPSSFETATVMMAIGLLVLTAILHNLAIYRLPGIAAGE